MLSRKHTSTLVGFLLICSLFLMHGCSSGTPVEPEKSVTTLVKPTVQPTATKRAGVTEEPQSTTALESIDFTLSPTHKPFAEDLRIKFQSAVDEEFSAIESKSGISVAVYTGDLLWTYATGKASESRTLTDKTPMMISSTSKTFLSALILIQINKGLYALTDSLETVLSDHPDFLSLPHDKININVTVQDLLAMSSGLPNYNANSEGKSELIKNPVWKPSDLIDLVQTSYVDPGTFEYNDTNVVLLGMIAEVHSGKQLADLFRETFYDPLSITAITLPEEGIPWHSNITYDLGDQLTTPHMAMPYGDLSPWSSGYGNIIDAAPFEFGYYIGAIGRNRYACCGIISTPSNMARWTYELYSANGSAVPESVRNELLNSFSEESIPPWSSSKRPGIIPEQYGYLSAKKAFQITADQTITAYGHLGGGAGYSAWMHYAPQADMAISILANSVFKVMGTCETENPGNCIVEKILATYLETSKG